MQDNLQGMSVIREDGVNGEVVTVTTSSAGTAMLVIYFEDGTSVAVSPQMLAPQEDGVYRLLLAPSQLTLQDAVVIPVAAEEVKVSTQQVERGAVRIHKRVETREETVETDLTTEEVTVQRVPVNLFVEGEAPQMREEDGVTIIPVFEEVLVVEKRLLLREEVRLTKQTRTSSAPQTVTLRREVVEIERTTSDGQTHAVDAEAE